MGYTSKFKGAEIDARLEKMVNVTYAELKALRDEGKLIAGQMYRMTDYETTCTWENTQVAGHPFDLVLTALDNKTLDEKCSAIWSERDTDGYFANSNLAAWDVRYCLDNDKDRFDWAQMGGTIVKISAYDAPFTFDGMYTGETYEIGGVAYYVWFAYVDGEMAFPFMTNSLNLSVGDEVYLSNTGESIDGTGSIVDTFEQVGGKGVIYRLIDEWENSVPYDFKNIMFSRPLTNGEYDDENGIETFCYTFSCYNTDILAIEDYSIIEWGCYFNRFGANCRDNVIFIEMWNACYENTIMDECYSNTLIRSSTNTFEQNCHSNILYESTLNIFRPNCSSNTLTSSGSNIFGEGCSSNTLTSSGSNIFGEGCSSNTLTRNNSNTFGLSCSGNTLGDSCNRNVFKNGCSSNTLVDWCDSNTFDSSCQENTISFGNTGCHFGYACQNNTLGSNCHFTRFGAYCKNNNIGNSGRENKFGNYCENNTLGESCSKNIFDNGCSNIILGAQCYRSSFVGYCINITLGEKNTAFYASDMYFKECSYIDVTAERSGTTIVYLQYYSINNVKGKSSAKVNIAGQRNREYLTYVTKKTDGTVVEYTVDDIINTQSSTPV